MASSSGSVVLVFLFCCSCLRFLLAAGAVGSRVGLATYAGNTNNPSATNQPPQQTGQKLWCVANPSAPDAELMKNLNFACGEGGANCKQLEPGGACYQPNSLISHASYAMNLYYQAHGRNYWNCYFHNTGLVVFTDPSYGGCVYPPQ